MIRCTHYCSYMLPVHIRITGCMHVCVRARALFIFYNTCGRFSHLYRHIFCNVQISLKIIFFVLSSISLLVVRLYVFHVSCFGSSPFSASFPYIFGVPFSLILLVWPHDFKCLVLISRLLSFNILIFSHISAFGMQCHLETLAFLEKCIWKRF